MMTSERGPDDGFVVAVRVRPANARELSNGAHRNVIKVLDANMICFDPKPNSSDEFANSARKKTRNFGAR